MTDAIEAARRLLDDSTRYSTASYYHDGRTVARALLAQHDDVVERCAEAAREAGGVFLRDRSAYVLNGPAGMVASMVAAIRALRSKP